MRPLISTLALLPFALGPALTAQDGGTSTVGRAAAKRFANLGRLPPSQTIVVADMINYHRHELPMPRAGQPVALDLRQDHPLPAAFGESVLQIGLTTARLLDPAHIEPLSLAVVVDCSSSMAEARKMACVKCALDRFIRRLRPQDQLAIVTYASEAQVVLPSSPVGDGRRALAIVSQLQPGGNTNLHAGLMLGYDQLGADDSPRANKRVILLTDGLANRGVTESATIAANSKTHNDQGLELSTIGVGNDFNHALLEELAKAGRGSFHFVGDGDDVTKVFDDEAQSLMGTVARDVRVELAFDPSEVEMAHLYGHDSTGSNGRAVISLDHFHHGMTRVILAKMRHGESTSKVDVRVQFDDKDGKRRTLQDSITLLPRPRATATVDHSVRKNFAIAVMARGLRRMAEAAERKQLGEADRYLQRALAFVNEHYPNTRDEDLTEIRSILEKHGTLLTCHIEAYRDL